MKFLLKAEPEHFPDNSVKWTMTFYDDDNGNIYTQIEYQQKEEE